MTEEAAGAELQRAMRSHAEGQIDAALAAARRAIALAPELAETHSYLGSTLITRKRRFVEGLRALEQASELAPDDPFIRYTLGWCYEYVAHELSPGAAPRGLPPRRELYRRAASELHACLAAGPGPDLRDDAEKLLERIEVGEVGAEEDE
ncbi:MAG: hypothetical protein EXR43_02620 [Dehalococcoidia bacterium]|nr:hypothetical protein [Dehalococcoidia bacterium]